jgi:hypothetical protein
MLWVAGYFGISFVVTVWIAYRVGQHRGTHARNGERLYKDGTSYSCDHTYCDTSLMSLVYFLSLFVLPILAVVVSIRKFVRLIQNGGFNSVQLPENSHPGIEITEVRLPQESGSSFWWLTSLLLASAALSSCIYYFFHR